MSGEIWKCGSSMGLTSVTISTKSSPILASIIVSPISQKTNSRLKRKPKTTSVSFSLIICWLNTDSWQRGVLYNKALAEADQVERRERRRAGDISRLTHHGKEIPDVREVHERLWKKLENSVSVWIVNGRLVRSVFGIDFTEGATITFTDSFPKMRSGLTMPLKRKNVVMYYCMNCTNAIAWPVVGPTIRLTQNPAASNIAVAITQTNSTKPYPQKVGTNRKQVHTIFRLIQTH